MQLVYYKLLVLKFNNVCDMISLNQLEVLKLIIDTLHVEEK